MTNAKLLLLAAALALGAAVHGQGRLVLPRSTVAAGDTLHVHGVGFAPGEVRLDLRGALERYALPAVSVGADSGFAVAWPVPREARPGAYRLVAIADDGDEITRADVAITAPVAAADPGPPAHPGHAPEPAHGEWIAEPPRADPMPLERHRSAAEWAVLALLIAGSAAGGLALVRRG